MNDSKLDRSATPGIGRQDLYAPAASATDSPPTPKILACFESSLVMESCAGPAIFGVWHTDGKILLNKSICYSQSVCIMVLPGGPNAHP